MAFAQKGGRDPLLWCSFLAVSKTRHSKTKTEARSTQISKTKHPKLENEVAKSRKRSTQDSKTKHPRLENEDYNFKSCMTQAKPGGGNGCVKALKWPRIAVNSSAKEGGGGYCHRCAAGKGMVFKQFTLG